MYSRTLIIWAPKKVPLVGISEWWELCYITNYNEELEIDEYLENSWTSPTFFSAISKNIWFTQICFKVIWVSKCDRYYWYGISCTYWEPPLSNLVKCMKQKMKIKKVINQCFIIFTSNVTFSTSLLGFRLKKIQVCSCIDKLSIGIGITVLVDKLQF